MPDPRLPQRPGSRQPAPQPHKGPPAERLTPGEPGTPAKEIRSRPIRPLVPSQQAPPVEFERKIRKGDAYWVVGSEHLSKVLKGKIVRLCNEPGKKVGIEFEEPIGGVDDEGYYWGVRHTCDGHGKEGHCLYVRPDQILDEKAMEAHKARVTDWEEAKSRFEEYEEMTVGPEHSQPLTPGMEDRMTIQPEDVGTIHIGDVTKKDKDEDD